jgi:hypothetical protein
MPRRTFEIFEGPEYPAPQFSSGAVAEILGIEVWQLQNFLGSPRYPLSPSGQLGHGKGSRRWFTTKDVYRIGVAAFLAKDGFAPKLISRILQRIEDQHLLDFDEHGEVYTSIALSRIAKGPKLSFFRLGHPTDIKEGSDVYYVLDLSRVTGKIDERIRSLAAKKSEA